MNMVSKLKSKLRESGVRGVVASALRRTANRLDRKSRKNKAASTPTNEFLMWVRFAVPGMLEQGNIAAMKYALANMDPSKPILEIGSFCGLSTVVMTYLCDMHSLTTPIFACDKWEFEGQHLGSFLGDSSNVTHDDYREYVRSTYMRSMQTFSKHRLPHTIECFSDEFFRRWHENQETVDVFDRRVTLGGEIGFCYIDGNHTYEFAKRDFDNTNRAMASGGFILFDDSGDGTHWEVNQLTREIMAQNEYELISKKPNYLFRKK